MESSGRQIQQACVIPFRDGSGGREFCLITSLKKRRWIFPKGIVDPGETPPESGLKEAWEEAGLKGQIVGSPIGRFADQKWGAQLDVLVLLMEVTREEQEWPESALRDRRWALFSEAMLLLSRQELQSCLSQAQAVWDASNQRAD